MKLHMTPRLPALPPLPVTPSSVVRPDRTTANASVDAAAASVAGSSVGVGAVHQTCAREDSCRVEKEEVVVVEEEEEEEEGEEKEEEVVAELLYEDKVPDIARVVEGTSEELNSISGSQHPADESLFYIHQSTGHGQSADSVLTHKEATNSARSPSVTMQEHNYSQAFSNGTAGHAPSGDFDTPVGHASEADAFGSPTDIDISVVELSVSTTVSPLSDPLLHDGTQSRGATSDRVGGVGGGDCNGYLGIEDVGEMEPVRRRGRPRGSRGRRRRSRGYRRGGSNSSFRGSASGVVVQPEATFGLLDTLNSIVPELAVRPQRKRGQK